MALVYHAATGNDTVKVVQKKNAAIMNPEILVTICILACLLETGI